MEKIRFAPLIRVSTESQEKKGESLNVQKFQIIKAVEALGGIIPDDCWEYSGQEHATIDFERARFNRLLDDAGKNKFDAVIVCDPSRWSRDNLKSKEGLKCLKENGIKFYAGTTEFDLYNPQANLFLGMSTEMNEFFAHEQSRKSLFSKILLAENNKPSSGKLPFGRTYDKKTQNWGIDEEKKQKIEWAADQYLAGQSMDKIAKTLGMNHTNLWKILKHRSGTKWPVTFKSKRLGIEETSEIIIPELLSPEVIEAIHRKSESNKTFDRKALKNKYLLSRVVFCQECGYAMFGEANRQGVRYYRHDRNRSKGCNKHFVIPAAIIEEAVIAEIYSLFGDKEKLDKAIIQSVPDFEYRRKIENNIEALSKELKIINGKKSNLLNAISEGICLDDDVKEKMSVFREQGNNLSEQIDQYRQEIKGIPSEDQIRIKAKFARNVMQYVNRRYYNSPEHFHLMSFEEKRKLIEFVFSIANSKKSRNGVYINRVDDIWHYEIKGAVSNLITGTLPLSNADEEKHQVIDLIVYNQKDAVEQELRSVYASYNSSNHHQ